MLDSQVNDKYKTGVEYHAVPPPYTGNFMPHKPNLILADMDEYVVSESITTVHAVATNKAKTSESKPKSVSEPLIEDWGNPQLKLQEKEDIDSGCSRHMTRNMSYLFSMKKLMVDMLPLVETPKEVKSLNSVLFTDTECVVLSLDFKLLDESQVLLRVPRKNNMYSVDLKNVALLGGIENLIDHKVKIIRCDNGNEFKNKEMNHFYEKQGNKREFSVAKTPQHNGVAERKNKTLIKAARTMLADSKLPTIFWTEAVNTAYYVQNRREGKKDIEGSGNKEIKAPITKETRVNQEKDNVNSINRVNAVSSTVNAASNEVNAVGRKSSIELPDDPNMHDLEDISIFKDSNEDFFSVEADLNNMETTFQVSPILTTRIHKDHPIKQIIKDIHSSPQTKRMIESMTDHEPKKVIQALTDPGWIEAMQDELLQFKLQQVWKLVDLPYGKRAIGTKWIYRNKKDERVARIEAIRLFLAYASFKDFVVYQLDVKSAFLYGKIEKEVYVCQPLGFEDLEFPNGVYKIDKTLFIKRVKGDILLVQVYVDDIIFRSTRKEMYTEFEKMIHKKFQMSSMGELTFFLRLQVTQKDDGIFISQDKYMDEILKKFIFLTVKTTNTPMETLKPLMKDENAKDVNVHLYRSMIGSLMYLTSLRLDIMFVDSPFDLEAYTDSDYVASLDRKSTIGGCQFLRNRLISWQCKKQIAVANSTTKADYVATANCSGHVLWIQNQMLDYGYNFMNTKIFIDNESTICIVKNLLFHSKTKHIKIRHHFIRDSYENGLYTNDEWNEVKQPLRMELRLNLAKNINEEAQIHVKVDGKKVIISKATIIRDLKFEDKGRVDCLSNEVIFEQLPLMSSTMASAIICLATNQKFNFSKYIFDSMKKQKPRKQRRQDPKETWPSGPTDDALNEENVPAQSNDPPLSRVNIYGSGEDKLILNELVKIYTKLQQRVIDLENTKTVQAQEISSLKKRVKRLEKKRRLRTHGLKRLYKIGLSVRVESSAKERSLDEEDASKQGRNIADINADADTILVDETTKDQGRYDDQEMFDIDVLNDEEVFVETAVTDATTTIVSINDITLALALVEIKKSKPKARCIIIKMLKNFNKVDLEVIWSIVKARFEKLQPVDDMDSFLLHTLKTMFEHHVEDTVWRNKKGLAKVKNWKLFDSCRVHCDTMQNTVYYLLVEKIAASIKFMLPVEVSTADAS
nr:hypothetical protein [Tanacetum cinerariifolium]